MNNDYSQLYADAGAQYGVDPALLIAQGQAESSGDPDAVGPETPYGRAKGIAQFIPATAKSLGVTDPNDPKQAIPAQAKLMAENLKRYGDVETALKAYHGGTNKDNWGPQTQAYPERVFKKYKGQQPEVDEEDPFEAAQKEISAQQSGIPIDEEDPFEAAKEHLAKNEKFKKDNPEPSITKDLALTAVSAPIKAIGAIPQIPAMAGNAIANATGYTYGKLAGATSEQQNKLSNLNPFFTGNTPADALTQAGNAIVNDNPGPANPLTGSVLHDPETTPGRLLSAGIQGAIAGPTTGVRILPSITGAAGAEVASEAFPNNPVAPLIGGALAATVPSAAGSIKLRSSPEELASNTLQNVADPTTSLAPGNINSHEIIPGSKPTLAQMTNDPNIALLERQLQAKNPAAFKAVEDVNESARQSHFEKAAGTAQDIEAMEDARETQRAADTNNIFLPGQEADPTPVVNKIDEILNGPGGKRTAVKKALEPIKNQLVDDEGNLTTDPETLYRSAQKEITDSLDKKNLDNSSAKLAAKELLDVKEVLDDTINKASPGFQNYLDNYSAASSKIDAARWMQDLKLTDASGRFTLAKVKNALTNAKKLQNSPGINAAKNLTPEQMQTLQDLHDDLFRRENVARASMPRGSNTIQNKLATEDMNSAVGKASNLLGINGPELLGTAVGAGAGSLVGMPGTGAFAGDTIARYLKNASSKRGEAATNALQNYTLTPENYKQYLLKAQNNNYLNRFQNKLLKP